MQEIHECAPVSRIRHAERRDAPRLIELVTALACHHGDSATVTPRALERDIFGPMACAMALVAERGRQVVGYALLCASPNLHFGLRVMDINHLFVDEDHRGSGIGRHLVAAAVAEARRQECGRLTVGTHPDNAVAQAVYLSLGFTQKEPSGKRFHLEIPASGALPAGWI